MLELPDNDHTEAGRDRPSRRRRDLVRYLIASIFSALLAGGGSAAFLVLTPSAFLWLADRVAWRLSTPPVLQVQIEKTQTAVQLRGDALVGPGSVLLFGDSHLQALPLPSLGAQVVNYAIAGEPAVRLRDRMRHYESVRTAGAVIVLTGQNDLAAGTAPPIVAGAVREILTSVTPTSPVILVQIPPTRGVRSQPEQRSRLNKELREVCDVFTSCRFASLDSLSDRTGELQENFSTEDNVHLNVEGYRVLSAEIVRHVKSILRQ